jgi:hypothetical protein
VLQSILEIFNNMVLYRLADNPELIYAMLMEKDMLTRFRTHPHLNHLIENLDKVCF